MARLTRDEIIELYGDGTGPSMEDIGHQAGVSRQRIHQIIGAGGPTPGMTGRPPTKYVAYKAARAAGMDHAEAAEAAGYKSPAIAKMSVRSCDRRRAAGYVGAEERG